MTNSILIKNGTFVDFSQTTKADIYIENGLITEIGTNLSKNCMVIDATDQIIMPAFIDMHVHLREPGFIYKEDLETGTKAACAGGFTTINLMANTKPIVSTMALAKEIVERANSFGTCDVYQSMSFTNGFDGKDLSHLDELLEDPSQDYVKFVSDDGFGIRHGGVFYQGLEKLKPLDRTVLIHAEDHHLSKYDMAFAEDLETLRDCYIASKLGAKVHFCHVSTKDSLLAILSAKKSGAQITFEVTPHHLALTDEVAYKVHPPLRSEADRVFLIDCIKKDLVDVIATDHAPHSALDKEKGAPGMIGLESAFPICYTELVKNNGVSLQQLSKLLSKTPADIMRINKGSIAVGVIGDLVLIDPNQEITIQEEEIQSKSKNTPFLGMTFSGKILKTIKAGRIVYESESEGAEPRGKIYNALQNS